MLEKVLSAPFLLTLALCAVVEVLALLLVYAYLQDFLASAFFSVTLLGPASIWVAPPFYRYMVKASQA